MTRVRGTGVSGRLGQKSGLALLTVWAALGAAGASRALEPVQPAPTPPSAAVRQIQQTELAFAQAVSQTGIAAGFRKYAGPGAIMFLPDPMPALPYLQTARSPGELTWRAQYIGVAPSDDLAFSLGPSLYKAAGKAEGGFYLTIWKRGPDGAWLFALDHSVDMPALVYEAPPAPATVFAIDPAAKPDQSQGLREADAGLDMGLSKEPPPAVFEPRLDDQILIVRANRPVASGKRKALKLLAEAPPIVEAQLLNAGLSADGLLGYTYGKARWTTAAGMQPGYYVRVWRNTGQGWRLLVDHLAER
jgi:ketosteroid isomerase-like protein